MIHLHNGPPNLFAQFQEFSCDTRNLLLVKGGCWCQPESPRYFLASVEDDKVGVDMKYDCEKVFKLVLVEVAWLSVDGLVLHQMVLCEISCIFEFFKGYYLVCEGFSVLVELDHILGMVENKGE